MSESEPTQQEASPADANDFQDLHKEISAIKKNAAWMRDQFQDDVDISESAQDGFDAVEPLPNPPEPIEVPDYVDMTYVECQRHLQAQPVIDPDDADERRLQTAPAVAERVEDAIEYFRDQLLPVATIKYDGRRHYFKEE